MTIRFNKIIDAYEVVFGGRVLHTAATAEAAQAFIDRIER